MFEVNNKDIVFIVNFEHVIAGWIVKLVITDANKNRTQITLNIKLVNVALTTTPDYHKQVTT